MIAPWMVSALVVALLAALTAWFTMPLMARRSLPRRGLWVAAMAVSVGVPLVFALRAPAVVAPTATAPRSAIPVVNTGTAAPVASAAGGGWSRIDGALLVGWGVASLLLAAVLGFAHWRTLRALSTWERAREADGLVIVSPNFGPAAVGLLRPHVVMPRWANDLPAAERALMVRHEREHIDARDHLVLLGGVSAVVLMPWNVALWWQLHRLRVAMELDCDARVARTPADRSRYGHMLLHASARATFEGTALALAAHRSAVTERLTALIDAARPSRRFATRRAAAGAVCAAAMALVPVPRVEVARLVPTKSVATATTTAVRSDASDRTTPPATAPDVPVTPAGARRAAAPRQSRRLANAPVKDSTSPVASSVERAQPDSAAVVSTAPTIIPDSGRGAAPSAPPAVDSAAIRAATAAAQPAAGDSSGATASRVAPAPGVAAVRMSPIIPPSTVMRRIRPDTLHHR